MVKLVSALALGLAVALAVPASAQQPTKPEDAKTKADCEKLKDTKWDEQTKKCVKK